MNPYVKLLDSTDIMSDSKEKTPTVSPEQGATSATPIIVPKELESAWFRFLKKREEDKDFRRCNKIIDMDLENSGWVESLEPNLNTEEKGERTKLDVPSS